MTGLDIISSAMRLIGVLASGETPSAAEAADGLEILNDLIDSWNAERVMIFTIARQVFTLVSGKQSYTMGAGGDFSVTRPAMIDRVSAISLANPAQPLEIPIQYLTTAQWQEIPVKIVQSALPQYVYDDGGFPLRTLTYWPEPNVGLQTAIYSWTALSSFADLATDYEFPPGYAKAIRFNLAVDLAPEFGRQLDQVVAGKAGETKAVVAAMNLPTVDLRCDAALVYGGKSLYNWLTDMPAGR